MLTSWHKARETARSLAKPLEAVELPLKQALGMALASPLRALTDMPAFDNSAMDGFAVAGPGPWRRAGRVRAGDEPRAETLRSGQCVEIATGAPVPHGADAVIPIEDCVQTQHHVTGPVTLGRHIRRAGEDCHAGLELVSTHKTITPAMLGLAASVGYDTLFVHRRPTVTLLLTGDELLLEGPPRPGRVRDAIGPVLPGLITKHADLLKTAYVRDDRATLTEALGESTDLIIVCGATSVGPADHLRGALRDLRADVLIEGVACRPGHPQLLAVLPEGRRVAGLPGNPFAALAATLTLVRPLLAGLGGHEVPEPTTARVNAVTTHPRDTRLVPVTRASGEAIPVGHDRPGSLRGVALADALAVIPSHWAGGQAELLPL
ncbi:molybdopterin molybdotransferase [Amycolatopsis xylanica]|uniref:Molybdopterin molybdenumtransferase n=1 Tax=Amycolatopsis xylanica TaxID=589385 RepID=A0A1H2T6E4_9PSEU|nr:molybdopterin molybdotransferase MoeA [Amycolatopsis xylanica]SDW39400.1 molybdopterin molybdotransferase [Amycolatopsis xylanica]